MNNPNQHTQRLDQGLLLLISGLLFLPFLGGVRLFDWDEINFAEVAREMVVLGDYLRVHINFELFWEKPPLFFWMQAGSMHLFGIGEYAARFPNAIAGMVTVLLLYRLGCRLADRRFGWFWALAWLGSLLPHLYAKSGLIDPWFNLFMFLGLAGFIRYGWSVEGLMRGPASSGRGWGYLLLGGVFTGLAILTKGPVGWLLPALTLGAYVAWGRFRLLRLWPAFLVWTLTALVTCGLWFGPEWARNGSWFTEEFLTYQWRLMQTEDAGHGGFPGYHVVVLLWGCFPASLFALLALHRDTSPERQRSDFRRWMILLLLVVLLVFSLVQSKIVHYSSLAYYPLTFLAAMGLHELHAQRLRASVWLGRGLWGVGGMLVVGLLLGLWVVMHPQAIADGLKDPFARAQLLEGPPFGWGDAWPAGLLLAVLGGGTWLLHKRRVQAAAALLFGGTALFVQSALFTYIVRAEEISQGPAMRWYESLAGEPVYVYSRFRSYAPFFYFEQPAPSAEYMAGATERAKQDSRRDAQHTFFRRQENDPAWLLHSPELDRDVYIVAKVQQVPDLLTIPGVQEMSREGGFVLLRRRAVKN